MRHRSSRGTRKAFIIKQAITGAVAEIGARPESPCDHFNGKTI